MTTTETTIPMTTHMVVLSGMNGNGGQNVIRTMKPFPPSHIHRVAYAHDCIPDLGQDVCMQGLHLVMCRLNKDPSVSHILVHATSQGTATILNYMGYYPDSCRKLSALVLESILASGNLSIASVCGATLIPIVNWTLPLLSTWIMAGYRPNGPQAIHSITSKWGTKYKHVPIVLLQTEEDRETPALGFYAVCAALERQGCSSVYSFLLPRHQHVGLLEFERETCSPEWAMTHGILKWHGLPYDPSAIPCIPKEMVLQVNENKSVLALVEFNERIVFGLYSFRFWFLLLLLLMLFVGSTETIYLVSWDD